MNDCWCICPQDWPQIPQNIKDCPWRSVSSDGTDDAAIIYACGHPQAQEVEFHVFEWKDSQELSSNMMTCPAGFSVEAGG